MTDNDKQMDVTDYTVKTHDENMFRIEGLNAKSSGCEFTIKLNKEFGDALKNLEVPDKQENARESLKEMYTDSPFTRLTFKDDSFLMTNITVAHQATGLDLYKEGIGEFVYHTHNVDVTKEAVQIISIFNEWTELAKTLLSGE